MLQRVRRVAYQYTERELTDARQHRLLRSRCGAGRFLDSWNGDPLLIGILVILIIVVARGRAANKRAGWGAVALMAVIFVSPLCALSSALFSARVLHHMLLIAAVAPLLALAFPMRRLGSFPLAVLVGVHAIILWVWHTPGLYAWGFPPSLLSFSPSPSLSPPPPPSQRTGLLADANIPPCKRLAPLAGNPRAHDPARVSTCRVRRDHWADGTTGRFDCSRDRCTRCILRARWPGA